MKSGTYQKWKQVSLLATEPVPVSQQLAEVGNYEPALHYIHTTPTSTQNLPVSSEQSFFFQRRESQRSRVVCFLLGFFFLFF
jgi:hypothetical protein